MTPWITKPVPFNIGQGVAAPGVAACTYQSGTTYTGWTFTGDYAVTGTVIQANCDVGTGNNGSSAWYEIESSNISETAWIMRWVWNFQSMTQSGGAPAIVGCGLYSASASAGSSGSGDGSWDPTQALAVIFASGDGNARYFQTCTSNAGNNFDGTVERSNLAIDQDFGIYYMQIQRHDVGGTDTLSYSYTDQSDWSSLITDTIDNASYMPSNLAFVKCESWQQSPAVQQSGIVSFVSDFKFNNDTSEPCG